MSAGRGWPAFSSGYVPVRVNADSLETLSVISAYSKLWAPPRNPRFACCHSHLMTRASL